MKRLSDLEMAILGIVRKRSPCTAYAVAREFSAIVAGGIAPFVGALLLGWFSNSWIPLAVYVIVLTAITLYTTFVTPETRARDLTLLGDASSDTTEQVAARPAPVQSAARAEFTRPATV